MTVTNLMDDDFKVRAASRLDQAIRSELDQVRDSADRFQRDMGKMISEEMDEIQEMIAEARRETEEAYQGTGFAVSQPQILFVTPVVVITRRQRRATREANRLLPRLKRFLGLG